MKISKVEEDRMEMGLHAMGKDAKMPESRSRMRSESAVMLRRSIHQICTAFSFLLSNR